ncbi:alpha/beta hydrolase [Paraburkholderia sp. J12]|uniref:alpha/beta fold hydrolase n=1 Tax=Paraburkholderia sp. J12 TaxID=2805432 RepID=UPI002ABE6D42|nr:alpha/beta hydrolase [Paraburkholderia sp. J12]
MSTSASANESPVREAEVLAGGIVTRYATAGTQGPAVLLVHGRSIGASGATEWHGLLPRLAAAGFRTYAPDHLSMGWTDLRPHAWPTEGYESLLAHLLAFLDAMRIDQALLIGNSMGAYLSARLALDHPDRVRAATLIGSRTLAAALGLVPTPAPRMPDEEDWHREGIRQHLLTQFNDPAALPQALLEARVLAAQRPGVREATEAFVAALNARARDEAARAAFMIDKRLPDTRVPMQFVWGERDGVAPVELAHRLARLLPAIPLSVIPEAGHLCHIERAEAVARVVVPFLKQNTA